VTEQEWLALKSPRAMLVAVRDHVSDRKLRLAACACCRAVWPDLRKSSRKAVEIAEQLPDGSVDEAFRDSVVKVGTPW
jgi:hypothetical protein